MLSKTKSEKKLGERSEQPTTAGQASSPGHHNQLSNPDDLSRPAAANFEIRPERLFDWARAGMTATHKEYDRLVARLRELRLEQRVKVILLNTPPPTRSTAISYLIANRVTMKKHPFQIEAQRSYAKKSHWIFLDLTTALRKELHKSKAWIYGDYDRTHWSPEGNRYRCKRSRCGAFDGDVTLGGQ